MSNSANAVATGTIIDEMDEAQFELFSSPNPAAAIDTAPPIGHSPVGSGTPVFDGHHADNDRRQDGATSPQVCRSTSVRHAARGERRLARVRARTRRAAKTLITHLQTLTRGQDDELAEAALAVLTRLRDHSSPLHARTFAEVYFEVRRQRHRIDERHRSRTWRAVEGLTVALFHALLHQFRCERNAARHGGNAPNPRYVPHPHE